MKFLILFILIVTTSFFSSSQEVNVSVNKLNITYLEIENSISVMVEGKECKFVTARTTNGTIKKKENCDFYYKPAKQGKSIIEVFYKDKFINSYEMRVKKLKEPVATLGGKLLGGNIRKRTLNAQIGIIALLKDSEYDARFITVSYNATICSKGYYFAEKSLGPYIPSNVKKAISNINDNATIIFSNIIVKGPDKIEREINNLVFNIIDNSNSENCINEDFIPKIKTYIIKNTSFTEFSCPCDKNMLLIQNDKTTIKGLNNDYFYSYKNVDNIKSKMKTTYYENSNPKSKLFIKFKAKNVNCPFDNNEIVEFSGMYKDQYLEWFKNGVLKTQGSYGLKETINTTDFTKDDMYSSCGNNWNCNLIEDMKHGEWKYYNKNGKLINIELFNLGELISINNLSEND